MKFHFAKCAKTRLMFQNKVTEILFMKSAPIPRNEKQRQATLDSYSITEAENRVEFDQLTKLATLICGTKMSLITLIDHDRLVFKSQIGLSIHECERRTSFCGHTVHKKSILIVNDARKDERFHDNPYVVENPNIIFYAGAPLLAPSGEALGTLCVMDDQPKNLSAEQIEALQILANQVVTHFRLHQEQKKQLHFHNQFKRLSEQVPGVIYQYRMFADGRSCFPYSSEAISEVYEVAPEEVKLDASKVFSRLHPDDYNMIVESILKSKSNLTTWSLDYRVILPVKGERWLRGSARPERMDDESTIWHGFITDITEEKQLELNLQQRSKMAALGEMAAGMAHEINNPLAIISGLVRSLKNLIHKDNVDLATADSKIEKINQTIDRVSKIIRGLRAFSRNAENDPYQKISLKTLIEESLALVTEKFKLHGVDISFICADDLSVDCNPTQIEQVIMNLVNNSYDAINQLSEKWVHVHASHNNGLVTIRVTDSGHGIPLDVLKKIMEPFFTTKPAGQGTGLGLSLSKGLIESHKGTLNYDINSKNTSFVIEIPQHQENVLTKAS